MCSFRALRSSPPSRSAAAPLVLTTGAVLLQLFVLDATAGMHEATEFSVLAGSPDEYMQAGAAFAHELDPNVEISYWDSQSGSLSVSRVEGGRVKCILRASPDIGEALKPLGRFLNGRIAPRAQAMFALAHEVGHCKLRDAFLNRSDGRAADASVFPWLAQKASADAYGILSVERRLGGDVPVRQAVIRSRMLSSAMYRDPNHATGHYVSEALALCHHNRDDFDAVQCAIVTAYYTIGSLANDEQGSPYAVDSKPELIYELGFRKCLRPCACTGTSPSTRRSSVVPIWVVSTSTRYTGTANHATSPWSTDNSTPIPRAAWPTITGSRPASSSPTTSAMSPRCALTVRMNWTGY